MLPTRYNVDNFTSLQLRLVKATGTGPAGQAKTGPLFSSPDWVMVINCSDCMVKVVTITRTCSDDCSDLLYFK